tara:strand:+ start:2591 stop:2764 length:174 start_codon:yes stop_codon:yes gene_type:complete
MDTNSPWTEERGARLKKMKIREKVEELRNMESYCHRTSALALKKERARPHWGEGLTL